MLEGLLDADLSDWLPQSQLDLSLEGFDTPPFTPPLDHLTPKESNELLLLASQEYESEFPDIDGPQPFVDLPPIQDDEPGIDDIFLAASQQFQTEVTEHAVENQRMRRFGVPVSSTVVEQSRNCGVPPKTRTQIMWSCRVWAVWVKDRKSLPEADLKEAYHECTEDIAKMNVESLQFWLPKFVLEARCATQQNYPPDSLCSICTGLQ